MTRRLFHGVLSILSFFRPRARKLPWVSPAVLDIDPVQHRRLYIVPDGAPDPARHG